jgi:hypothetical protein
VSRQRAWTLWIAWCLVYLAAITLALGLRTPYPGDEQRFIETGRLFANGVSIDLLKHYPEMSGPLPFWLFGMWGKAAGDSLAAMRIFALLTAFATLLLVFRLALSVLGRPGVALAASVGLCLNPYMATMSLFVYTDMPTLLFALVAMDAALNDRPVRMAAGLAAAAISRQYLTFLTAALAAFFAARWWWRRDAASLRMAAAALISALPLLGLIALWRGLAPDSWMRNYYVTGPPRYRLSSLAGYVAQLPVYLAPFVIAARRTLLKGRWIAPVALAAAAVYPFFPIRAPERSADIGIHTVGLVDRALTAAAPSPLWREAFFWLAFAAGTVLVGQLWAGALRQWRAREPGYALAAGIVLCAFLAVMPWSYLYWEKYLLPVLPVCALQVALSRPRAENRGKI